MKNQNQSNLVATFDDHTQAEVALRALGKSGFDMKKLSIIGRDYHSEEHAVGFYNAGDRVKYWGKLGAFWGSVFGILFAPAFFFIPGIGPILTGGVIGSMIMGTLEGAAVGAAVVGGASAFGAALTSIGIPEDTVVRYIADLKASRYLLIAEGTPAQVELARQTLVELSVGKLDVHSSGSSSSARASV